MTEAQKTNIETGEVGQFIIDFYDLDTEVSIHVENWINEHCSSRKELLVCKCRHNGNGFEFALGDSDEWGECIVKGSSIPDIDVVKENLLSVFYKDLYVRFYIISNASYGIFKSLAEHYKERKPLVVHSASVEGASGHFVLSSPEQLKKAHNTGEKN